MGYLLVLYTVEYITFIRISITYNIDFSRKICKSRKSHTRKFLNLKKWLLIIKQGGENINTGNIAKCFFEHPDEVSKATQLNKNLIIWIYVILQAVSWKISLTLFENSQSFKYNLWTNTGVLFNRIKRVTILFFISVFVLVKCALKIDCK